MKKIYIFIIFLFICSCSKEKNEDVFPLDPDYKLTYGVKFYGTNEFNYQWKLRGDVWWYEYAKDSLYKTWSVWPRDTLYIISFGNRLKMYINNSLYLDTSFNSFIDISIPMYNN